MILECLPFAMTSNVSRLRLFKFVTIYGPIYLRHDYLSSLFSKIKVRLWQDLCKVKQAVVFAFLFSLMMRVANSKLSVPSSSYGVRQLYNFATQVALSSILKIFFPIPYSLNTTSTNQLQLSYCCSMLVVIIFYGASSNKGRELNF